MNKMKISTFILLLLISCGLMIDFTNRKIYGDVLPMEHYGFDNNQPPPLILDNDSNFILQPLVENIDLKGYEIILSLKLYYKDKMVKPLDVKKGPPIDGYCSDSTIMVMHFEDNDSIMLGSIKRMSCKILAIFNLEKSDNVKLRIKKLNNITITNYVTENKYNFVISDKTYFNRWVSKYGNWR